MGDQERTPVSPEREPDPYPDAGDSEAAIRLDEVEDIESLNSLRPATEAPGTAVGPIPMGTLGEVAGRDRAEAAFKLLAARDRNQAASLPSSVGGLVLRRGPRRR